MNRERIRKQKTIKLNLERLNDIDESIFDQLFDTPEMHFQEIRDLITIKEYGKFALLYPEKDSIREQEIQKIPSNTRSEGIKKVYEVKQRETFSTFKAEHSLINHVEHVHSEVDSVDLWCNQMADHKVESQWNIEESMCSNGPSALQATNRRQVIGKFQEISSSEIIQNSNLKLPDKFSTRRKDSLVFDGEYVEFDQCDISTRLQSFAYKNLKPLIATQSKKFN